MTYRFAVCAPAQESGNSDVNQTIFAAPCLGIEITEPGLARRCSLGNVDPQHSGRNAGSSAIRACTDLPLPPADATLVTLRPDADAIGAMAVLSLRASGFVLGPSARQRIALIDRADRFANGVWPGPRPLPQSEDEIDEVGLGPQGLGAMLGLALDRASPGSQDEIDEVGLRLQGLGQEPGMVPDPALLDEKVQAFRRFIREGVVPGPAAEAARSAAVALFAALRDGRVQVQELVPRRIVLVRGFVTGALRLGYRMAPLVVAENEASIQYGCAAHRRITIAQYAEGYADFERLLARLNAQEPGWGGSPTILGSPQGVPTAIPLRDIVGKLLDSALQPVV